MRFADFGPRRAPEILDDAVGLYRRNARPLLAVGVVLLLPAGIVLSLGQIAQQVTLSRITSSGAGASGIPLVLGVASLMFALLSLYSLVAAFARGALILGAAGIYGGEPVEVRPLLAAAWHKALPYLVTEFLVSMAVGLAALLFIVLGAAVALLFSLAGPFTPGVVLAVVFGLSGAIVATVTLAVFFGLSGPIVMVEDRSLFDAMGRSYELVRGRWRRVAGLLLAIGVLSVMLQSIVTIPAQLVAVLQAARSPEAFFATGSQVLSTGLQSLLAAIGVALVAPLTALVQVGILIDVRVRREGEDLAAAIQALA